MICSYPLDTVGMIKAIHEIGFKPKMLGGAMVGLQATAFKTQLGPLLNGIVNFETWLPVKRWSSPASMELLKKYQERAGAAGVDPLGYYMPVWAYAELQVLGQAIAATKSLDDDKLADYIRETTFKTVVGDVKFGPQGEWAEERTLAAQFQNINGNSIDDIPRPQDGGDRLSAAIQERRRDLSLRECDKITVAPRSLERGITPAQTYFSFRSTIRPKCPAARAESISAVRAGWCSAPS